MGLSSVYTAAARCFTKSFVGRASLALAATVSFGAAAQAAPTHYTPHGQDRTAGATLAGGFTPGRLTPFILSQPEAVPLANAPAAETMEDIVVTAPRRCTTENAFSAVPRNYRASYMADTLNPFRPDATIATARMDHARLADYATFNANLRSQNMTDIRARQGVMARTLLDVAHDFRTAYGVELNVSYLSGLKQIESGMGHQNFRPRDVNASLDRRIGRALGPSQIQLGFFQAHWEESWGALQAMTANNGLMDAHPLYAQLLAKADPLTGKLAYKDLTNREKNELRLDPYFASVMSLTGVLRRAGLKMSVLDQLHNIADGPNNGLHGDFTSARFAATGINNPCGDDGRAQQAQDILALLQDKMNRAAFWGRAYAGHQLGEGGLKMVERGSNGASQYRARYPANVRGNPTFWRGIRSSEQLLANFENRLVAATAITNPMLEQARPAYAMAAIAPKVGPMLAGFNTDISLARSIEPLQIATLARIPLTPNFQTVSAVSTASNDNREEHDRPQRFARELEKIRNTDERPARNVRAFTF